MGGVTLFIFYGSTFYGSTVLTTAVRFRQIGRQTGSNRLQAGRRAQVRQTGWLKSGSQAEVRLGDDGSLGKDVYP